MYQNCGGIQLQSVGFEAHFKLGGQLNEEMEVLTTGSGYIWDCRFRVYIGSSISSVWAVVVE